MVQPTGDAFLDGFLLLPADTLAVMSSQFVFPAPIVVAEAATAASDAVLQT